MKKFLFVLMGCLLLGTFHSYGQQSDAPKWFYINVKININGVITIDRGDYPSANRPKFYQVLGEDNNKFKSGSIVSALNYMSEKGWSVATGYVTAIGTINEYLMRKETTGFENATVNALFDNLRLKAD